MGEVLEVLPFQNTLATFRLKGADVVASLESGVSQIEDGAGRFPQVSGLRFTFDASAEPGSRISEVQAQSGEEWEPINPDAVYTIATNNFMRTGGDGYSLFAENAMDAYDYGPGLEQVLADHLAENSPYQPYTDGRITEAAAAEQVAQAEMPAAEDEAAEPEAGQEEPEIADEPAEPEPAEPAAEEPEAAEPEAAPGTAPEATEPAETESAAEPAGEGAHTVARGDTYWDLAARYLGDPLQWRRIAEANPQYQPRRLPVGATLTIPAEM